MAISFVTWNEKILNRKSERIRNLQYQSQNKTFNLSVINLFTVIYRILTENAVSFLHQEDYPWKSQND